MNEETLRVLFRELAQDAQMATVNERPESGLWLIPVDTDEQNAENIDGRLEDDPSNPQMGVVLALDGRDVIFLPSLMPPDDDESALRAFFTQALEDANWDCLQDGFAIYKAMNAPNRPRPR